jgi:TRAP-type C4-dicarboxylate transport system permease small subunit
MARPKTGRNLLLAVDTWVTRVCKWLSMVAAFCGGLMMIIAVIDVIGHSFFRIAIPMGVEFIEELNVYLVFLAIAYVALERGHIRITVVERLMPNGLILVFRLLGCLIGIAVFSFASLQALKYTLYGISVPLEKSGVIDFVRWPFIMGVFIGFSLLVISFILLIGRIIRAWSKGEPISL